MTQSRFFLLLLFISPFLTHCGSGSSLDFETTTVVIQSVTGSITIFAEVADTEEKRDEGLSGQLILSDSSGMLFVFDAPDVYTFTMESTYLSLDIIFISEDQRIIDIEENTTPLSFTPITPSNEILYALEVNAGFVEANGVAIDDTVVF